MTKKRGFTLVEILVTISILGIMMGVVVMVLDPSSFRSKARDGRRQSDLQVIQSAIEMYYAQNSAYPSGADATSLNSAMANGGGGSWAAGGVTYLSRTPTDPQALPHLQYCYATLGSGYLLCSLMENSSGTWTPGTCASQSYNYCLQNTY